MKSIRKANDRLVLTPSDKLERNGMKSKENGNPESEMKMLPDCSAVRDEASPA